MNLDPASAHILDSMEDKSFEIEVAQESPPIHIRLKLSHKQATALRRSLERYNPAADDEARPIYAELIRQLLNVC